MREDSSTPAAARFSPVDKAAMRSSDPGGAASCCRLKQAVVLLPLAYLWFRLINNLRLEWATNPQYSYGWVVPFLCVAFLLQRWQGGREKLRAESGKGKAEIGKVESGNTSQSSSFHHFSVLTFCLLAFSYLPTRLIEEATPEWRPIQWALGFEAVGLTLCAVYLTKGRGWLRQVAFPLCFFFVAIPWPTIIEAPVIQSLTRINSAVTVELLGWLGIPAVQHGNLIEVSTGMVGVSEACSGIRSFQTSLMVSLFFGEFYAMGLWRRMLLIPTGFILAMAFNVCRMSFLTLVAARKGVAAIAQYHDPAGVAITITCTLVLWGVSVLFNKKLPSEVSGQKSAISIQNSDLSPPRSDLRPLTSGLFPLSLALLVWLIAVEVGSELWYRHLESHLAPSPKWTVEFPTNEASFETLPIGSDTAELLRFDDGEQGAWTGSDGSRWQAFYFDWQPGRVAGYLAKRHTPEVCMPASGRQMVSGPILTMMTVNGVALPVHSYVFDTDGGSLYVFHCRWEAGVNEDAYVTHEGAHFNLIRGIWAGRGKCGQKVLEIIISGCPDADQAKAAFERQLQTMIKVEKLKS